MLHNDSSAQGINADLHAFRRELVRQGISYRAMWCISVARPILDIVCDWLGILLATYAVWRCGLLVVLPAVLVIANRQRSLGNIMHDASHRNLSNSSFWNDTLARLFLAPALFSSLTIYRLLHAQHHAFLGDPLHDPDYMDAPRDAHGVANKSTEDFSAYCHFVLCWRSWRDSVFGHFFHPKLVRSHATYLVSWWIAVLFAAATVDVRFTLIFFSLWMLAKASLFHMFTIFREMCDHYGLQPGGIFSFTRDIDNSNLLGLIIHPRNNGYHLTHHLLPKVPYYRLQKVQKILMSVPMYRDRSVRCTSYFYWRKFSLQLRIKAVYT